MLRGTARLAAMALLAPNGGSNGEVVLHNDLGGRSAPDAHPISAISGLQGWLDTLQRQETATAPLRYRYSWTNANGQDVNLPQPYDTSSAVIAVVRLSDGALVEPDVNYFYTPDGSYIRTIRLSFHPAISGDHVIHVVR